MRLLIPIPRKHTETTWHKGVRSQYSLHIMSVPIRKHSSLLQKYLLSHFHHLHSPAADLGNLIRTLLSKMTTGPYCPQPCSQPRSLVLPLHKHFLPHFTLLTPRPLSCPHSVHPLSCHPIFLFLYLFPAPHTLALVRFPATLPPVKHPLLSTLFYSSKYMHWKSSNGD